MTARVTVYTRPGCGPCAAATVRHLRRTGIPFETVDVSQDEDAAQELRDGGFTQSPVVTVVTDGAVTDVWSGYRRDRLDVLRPADAA